MRAELARRTRMALRINQAWQTYAHTTKKTEARPMHKRSKRPLIILSIGLLMIMFSPILGGVFYPVSMSIGVALGGYATYQLMHRAA